MANSLGENIEKRYVVLKRKYYKGNDPTDRVFFCEGGFGCRADTIGSAVVGTFVFDGEHIRAEGYEIERFATYEEIEQATGRFEELKQKEIDNSIGENI